MNKSFSKAVKLALNNQPVFTKSDIETLEQVVKYVQSFIVNVKQISHVVPMFP